MPKSRPATLRLWLFLIGLLFGGAIGFVIAAGNSIDLSSHDHDSHAHATHAEQNDGHHEPINVIAVDVPELDIEISVDPVSGYNIALNVQHLQFAPDHAGMAHKEGEGHAHIYVDGVKYARLYSSWYHMQALPKGMHEITVTLNANDHRPLAIAGKIIQKKLTLQVQ